MEKELYLAAGCFWGAEHFFKQIQGVTYTEVGFANGNTDNPTYEQVYTDTTGYAETVHLRYDPLQVSLGFLLEMYFKAIDPTSLNQQGEDRGTRYRTGIYYTDPDDLPFINFSMAQEAPRHGLPLQVEVQPLRNFYPAEEYHQDYLDNNPTGYCHLPVALFDYARNNSDRATLQKAEKYALVFKQLQALSEGETDTIALMANTAALLHETFRFWWTGYYRVVGDGEADVEQFPGHIACSAASRSEIVVPVRRDGSIVAVLDIDSQYLSTFDYCDRHWLERIVAQ